MLKKRLAVLLIVIIAILIMLQNKAGVFYYIGALAVLLIFWNALED